MGLPGARMTADPFAEAVVAACAAASAHGAELAHRQLVVADFTQPAYAAVFTAARDLPTFPTPTDHEAAAWARARLAGGHPVTIWPSELRVAVLAERLGANIHEVERLLALRPVADDITGTYAQRVKNAAVARRLERNVVELHELLRNDSPQHAAELAGRIAHDLAEAS